MPKLLRALTFIVILLVIVVFFVFKSTHVTDYKVNYLNSSYLYFDNHTITDPYFKGNKILILGSSAASGNNIPIHSTTPDFINYNKVNQNEHFYNLGLMEATLVDSIAIAKEALIYSPKEIIYALNPGNFRSLSGRFSLKYMDGLDKHLPSDVFNSLKREKAKKFELPGGKFLALLNLPSFINIKLQEKLYFWKKEFWGERFDKDFFRLKSNFNFSVKDTIRQLDWLNEFARKNKIKISYYFEPMILKNPKEKEHYKDYRKKLISYLEEEKYKVADFTSLFPKEPTYFVDFVHLTPVGNTMLANKIIDWRLNEF